MRERGQTAPAASVVREDVGRTSEPKLQIPLMSFLEVPGQESFLEKQLAQQGPATSLRDIGTSICKRMALTKTVDEEEIKFLSELMKNSKGVTTLPWNYVVDSSMGNLDSLCNTDQTEDDIQKWLENEITAKTTPPPRPSIASLVGKSSKCPGGANLPIYSKLDTIDKLRSAAPTPKWPCQPKKECKEDGLVARLGAPHLDFEAVGQMVGDRKLLQFVGWDVLRSGGFFNDFGLSVEKTKRFLQRLEAKYGKTDAVPYHNSLHAADVTHTVREFLVTANFERFFCGLSKLSLLFSAMVHDVAHDGRTNAFHVAIQDELALTYNDKSVLENFHVSQAFRLIRNEPQANLFQPLSRTDFLRLRKKVIDCVLCTDMSNHFSVIESLKAFVEERQTSQAEGDGDDIDEMTENAQICLQPMLLHAADIGQMSKPTYLSDLWVSRVRKEFLEQGHHEVALGLPFSPLCDPNGKFAGPQCGFISFIVKPTFESLAPLSDVLKQVRLKAISKNFEAWEKRKHDEDNVPPPLPDCGTVMGDL